MCRGNFRSRAIQTLRKRQIVHGIDAVKHSRRFRGLIALQVTDQVPFRAQAFDRAALPFPFLHSILAKMIYAEIKRGANRFSRMGLRHCNQRDFVGTAACAFRGGGDALPNRCNSFR